MPLVAPLLRITSGWTGLLGPFTLRADGLPFDLTGFNIELILRGPDGSLITPGGTITKLNQTTNPGQITYQPVATDFVWASGTVFETRQPFYIHWKVTDGSNHSVTFPHGDADEISVFRL